MESFSGTEVSVLDVHVSDTQPHLPFPADPLKRHFDGAL